MASDGDRVAQTSPAVFLFGPDQRRQPAGIRQNYENENESLIGDSWPPQQPAAWGRVETRMLLERVLRALTDDERDLLRLRCLDELSQVDTAVVLGINQMALSRRLTRLMLKLREEIGDRDDDVPAGERYKRA